MKYSDNQLWVLETTHGYYPLGTQDTSNRYALAMPYLVKFNGTGGANSIDEPLDTITSTTRAGIAPTNTASNGSEI